jgi:hypothetical protein
MLVSPRSRLAVLIASLPLATACGAEPGPSSAAESDSAALGERVTSVAPAEDSVAVTVVGRVLDEASGEGVAGGYVIVLAPGVSFEEWERSPAEEVEDLMAGAAMTDSLGRYAVTDLPRGLEFTVVVAARDHAPAVFEGGLVVESDDPPLTRIADVRLEPR